MNREEMLKVAKPILFNTEMVQAILDGRKTVTRRVIKPQPEKDMVYKLGYCVDGDKSDIGKFGFGNNECGGNMMFARAPYQPGDTLYVRETWCRWYLPHGKWLYCYRATDPTGNTRPTGAEYDDDMEMTPWHPSIHMPKEAARIFLRVTNVRVERLQDITNEQILKEGASLETIKHYIMQMPKKTEEWIHAAHTVAFSQLWDAPIKKANLNHNGWDVNPWVWVIDFERQEVSK